MSSACAIIVGHGDFARGMMSAVAQIVGRDDFFIAMSNADLCAADIEVRLRELMDEHDIHVIFTDLPAGSCAMGAHRVLIGRPDVTLVSGASLPLLLAVAASGDVSSEALGSAVEKARQSIRASTGKPRVD